SRSCGSPSRERRGRALEDFNRQVLHQAVAEELTPARRGALDGTLVEANASRHRLVNEATLSKRLAQLAAVVAAPAAAAAAPAAQPVPGEAVAPPAATAPLTPGRAGGRGAPGLPPESP